MSGNSEPKTDDPRRLRELSCQKHPGTSASSSKHPERLSLDILILGQAGSGKSATGNSIILHKAFETSNSSSYESSNIQSAWSEYTAENNDMYTIKVTDGPCLEEIDPTIKANEIQACENIAKVLTESPNGFHVIVITVRMGLLFTEEHLKPVEKLLLNGCLEKHGVIVVTFGDSLMNSDVGGDERSCFMDWCDRQTSDLRRWFYKCKNRVVLFDNKTEDESIRVKQLENFLHTVKQLAREDRYTNKLFPAIAKEYQEQIKKFGLPPVCEETRKKISILQGKISQIDSREDLPDVEGELQAVLEKITMGKAISTKIQCIFNEMRKEQTGEKQFKNYALQANQCIDEMIKRASLQQKDNSDLYHALGDKLRALLRPRWRRLLRSICSSCRKVTFTVIVFSVLFAYFYFYLYIKRFM